METLCVRIPGNTKALLKAVSKENTTLSGIVREGIGFAVVIRLGMLPLYISLCTGKPIQVISPSVREYAIKEVIGTRKRAREIMLRVNVDGSESILKIPCPSYDKSSAQIRSAERRTYLR